MGDSFVRTIPRKIDWTDLSANPNAMHLLFHVDYTQMKEQNEIFKEELVAYVSTGTHDPIVQGNQLLA